MDILEAVPKAAMRALSSLGCEQDDVIWAQYRELGTFMHPGQPKGLGFRV